MFPIEIIVIFRCHQPTVIVIVIIFFIVMVILLVIVLYSGSTNHGFLSGDAVRHLLSPAQANQPSETQQMMEEQQSIFF